MIILARSLRVGTPASHRVCSAFVPRFANRREVLAVRCPSNEYAEQASRDDIKGMVTRVHDTRHSDEGCAQGGDEDNEGLPDFAFVIENVEFCRKIE